MIPAERWIHRLAKEVAPLQIGRGGPILMTQVENEYGNFGSDHAYMQHLKQIFLNAGFTDSLLYSADNWRNIPNGSIPDLLAAVNFGIGNHQGGMNALAKLRPDAPLFVSEYWPGWFDSWGHPHGSTPGATPTTRPIPPQLEDLDYILHRGAGINIYMFHGGTSFGFMSGAGSDKNGYRPTVTSYDYDAPLDESGRPTPKFYAYRKVLAQFTPCPSPPSSESAKGSSSRPEAARYAAVVERPLHFIRTATESTQAAAASAAENAFALKGRGFSRAANISTFNGALAPEGISPQYSLSNESCLPPIPATPPIITIPQITLTESTPLWTDLPQPTASKSPQPMEHFGQSFGYILYRTQLPAAITGDLVLTNSTTSPKST